MGSLRRLTTLAVENNPNLRELPMSLGQISRLTDISCDRALDEIADVILRQCRAGRDAEAVAVLPERLATWKASGQAAIDIPTVLGQLDVKQKKDLNEWLLRLERTKDFANNHAALAKIVCDMLVTVGENKTFRELFFVQVAFNNKRCEDRSSMSLNEIYSSWKIHTLPPTATLQDKLTILTGVAKTLALRKALSKCISPKEKETHKDLRESVEIYLYYEISLKDTLNLITAIEGMSYAEIGRRDWINENELVIEVNRDFFDSLYTIPAFEEILKSDASIAAKFEELQADYQGQFGDAPEGDENDSAVLEWRHNVAALTNEMKGKQRDIAKEWYINHIGSDQRT